MADFTLVQIGFNEGTDAAADWTGNVIAFGGSAGANEFRFQRTGGGGTGSTGSASWPNIIKPGSVGVVEEMWAFASDTVGLKVNYDGTIAQTLVLRFDFDANGSPASAMQFSAFQDTSDTTPTPGSQTANATDGRNIINGQATDTSSTSYLKGNAFGSGKPAGGQETPSTSGNAGTTLAATSGTAGSVSPGAGAWLATWQSLQGWTQYITAPALYVPAAGVGYWYIALVMYVGPNEQTGNMVFCPLTLQYTWT